MMQWIAKFGDGTIMREDEGARFADAIERGGVTQIGFDSGQRVYTLDIPADAAPFARRRHALAFGSAGAQSDSIAAHILGYTSASGSTFLFILPDGSVRQTDNLEAV